MYFLRIKTGFPIFIYIINNFLHLYYFLLVFDPVFRIGPNSIYEKIINEQLN